ncbi:hypothetical protein [Alteromonas confluentis]|uniref:Uncharacterized protein n=1 Tax=Alteromonas confluentis TaxID=1656094 RepID=A0A1E7Z6C3_9ALTE|nr:hypothetical protein [Alteromonas confluentis]OFC69093.1 hypothetical protein BFC18_20380 [Alteromonas confluentis]
MLRFFSYYLLIGLVTASVTLGFHLYYRKTLERPYSKKALAIFFPFELLFWPLFFIAALSRGSFKPVLEQSKSFRLPKPMPIDPEEERRRIAFRQGVYKNPPFCGKYIYEYGSGFRGFDKDDSGIFIFEAKDVAAFLAEGRHGSPYEIENSETLTINLREDDPDEVSDTQLIQRWAECADSSMEFYSEIAGCRGEFRYIIRNMVAAGIGQSYCVTCNKHYPNSAMSVTHPPLENGRGWIIDFIQCPKEHTLMDIEIMHFF